MRMEKLLKIIPLFWLKGPLPEIWSIGHRNAQGLFIHPKTGDLWEQEHGPRGGDEINLIEKGKNYWLACYHKGQRILGA